MPTRSICLEACCLWLGLEGLAQIIQTQATEDYRNAILYIMKDKSDATGNVPEYRRKL